jgi:nucleoside-diphosphate-sugar epimerase
LSDLPVRRVTVDLRDPRALADSLRGAACVYHLAAATAPRSLAEARAINVQGTRALATAAAQQPDVPVFIYVSSLAAAGPSDVPATEDSTCHPVSVYGRTKLEAEQALCALSDRVPITVVRPPGVFGPGDPNLRAMFRSIHKGWNFYTRSDFRYSLIYVEDLVTALLAAWYRGRRLRGDDDPLRQGLYYVADPQAVTFPELARLIAACVARDRVRQVRVPRGLAWIAATLGEGLQRTVGCRVYLNRDKVREAYAGSWMCDPARARQQLGIESAADLSQRLADTADSLRQSGWLPPR